MMEERSSPPFPIVTDLYQTVLCHPSGETVLSFLFVTKKKARKSAGLFFFSLALSLSNIQGGSSGLLNFPATFLQTNRTRVHRFTTRVDQASGYEDQQVALLGVGTLRAEQTSE